jgi:hypothetical protein
MWFEAPLPCEFKGGQNAGVVWRFASIALTPGPAPARGSGVARSDGVRAFQRVRTQNTPWVEPMFCPPFNRSGSEVWDEGSGKNPTPES